MPRASLISLNLERRLLLQEPKLGVVLVDFGTPSHLLVLSKLLRVLHRHSLSADLGPEDGKSKSRAPAEKNQSSIIPAPPTKCRPVMLARSLPLKHC